MNNTVSSIKKLDNCRRQGANIQFIHVTGHFERSVTEFKVVYANNR